MVRRAPGGRDEDYVGSVGEVKEGRLPSLSRFGTGVMENHHRVGAGEIQAAARQAHQQRVDVGGYVHHEPADQPQLSQLLHPPLERRLLLKRIDLRNQWVGA